MGTQDVFKGMDRAPVSVSKILCLPGWCGSVGWYVILQTTGGKHKARSRIRPSALFYSARHLVSTQQQGRALA